MLCYRTRTKAVQYFKHRVKKFSLADLVFNCLIAIPDGGHEAKWLNVSKEGAGICRYSASLASGSGRPDEAMGHFIDPPKETAR